MERLTFDGKFCDIAQCRETPGGSFCENGTCSQKEVWLRLKAYEDTGLTPEQCAEYGKADREGRYIVLRDAEQEGVKRLRELAEADKDGRLVVLPCRIGSTVYVLIQDNTIFYPETNGWYIGEDTIDAIAQDGFYLGNPEDGDFRPNDAIGEIVFLTREEAERALQEMEGKA